jgi:hypothetical protein
VYINKTLIHQSNETGNRTITINAFDNISLYYQKNYTIWVNATVEYNSTDISGWFNTGSEVYCMALAFDMYQLGILIWALLYFWAEKKEDWLLFIISSLMLLPLGVYYLAQGANNMAGGLKFWVGFGFIIISMYSLGLAVLYAAKGQKRFKD